MGKSKGQAPIVKQDESLPTKETQPRHNTEEREQRVNIAEEFYLEVTERPDVREILRRLAKI